VTWGAGGSTRERSLELASLTQEVYGIDTILHLTCTNLEPGTVDDVLRVRALSTLVCLQLTGSADRKGQRNPEHIGVTGRYVAHTGDRVILH
jgi:methylenetetrahydrofolate reductase (NADPH)